MKKMGHGWRLRCWWQHWRLLHLGALLSLLLCLLGGYSALCERVHCMRLCLQRGCAGLTGWQGWQRSGLSLGLGGSRGALCGCRAVCHARRQHPREARRHHEGRTCCARLRGVQQRQLPQLRLLHELLLLLLLLSALLAAVLADLCAAQGSKQGAPSLAARHRRLALHRRATARQQEGRGTVSAG